MKILQLDIEGFRSFKKVSWRPSDLNVIIGPNGTGKSNLLRFLELISVSAEGRLGKYIQSLGGMDPIVWDGQATRISFMIKTSFKNENQNVKHDGLIYLLELARLGKGSSYQITDENLSGYSQSGKQSKPPIFLEKTGSGVQIFDHKEQFMFTQDDLIAIDKASFENTETETYLSIPIAFVSDRQIPLLRYELEFWAIYHDLQVHKDALLRQAAVARLERRIEPDGQNLIPVLHTLYTSDRDFKKDINSAMRAAFGDDFEELIFPPAADQRIQLRVRWKSLKREQSAADLSDGTLRFLLLLTILANPSPSSLIAIDEPETGLHPSMLPIIAEYAVDAATKSVGIKTVRFEGWRELVKDTPKKALMHLNGPEQHDIVAVIALLDLYGPMFYPADKQTSKNRYDWAKAHLESKINHPKFRQFFAVHETEAWLLSHPNVFPAEIKNALPKNLQHPEEVNFDEPPAKLLERIYKQKTQRPYKKVAHGSELFRKLDPQLAYTNCPRFKELLDEMLKLAKEAGF